MESDFKTVSIIGMGLLGGSIGLSLLKYNPSVQVIGVGRNPNRLQKALNVKACHKITTDYQEGVQNADLIIVCTPVGIIPELVQNLIPHTKSSCIITDVGSTKQYLVDRIQSLKKSLPDSKQPIFIGGHPMAGSDKVGIEFAKAELYQNKRIILTPDKETDQTAVKQLSHFWEMLGGDVLLMDPATHDKIVALTSHLPHLIACTLVSTLKKSIESTEPDQNVSLKQWLEKKIYGTGLLDSTRIAMGDEELWNDIFNTNLSYLNGFIEDFIKELKNIQQDFFLISNNKDASLDNPGLKEKLADIKAFRQRF